MVSTYRLECHPLTPTNAVDAVEVAVVRRPGGLLQLDYTLVGNRGSIEWALSSSDPKRTDGLWRDTCFEAFLMPGSGPEYLEFNFAFTFDWAAYAFAGRRAGMSELDIPAPDFDRSKGTGDLTVALDLSGVESLDESTSWKLGLSAVLVDLEKSTSYWALAHPEGAPDFHDPACFTARLAAPQSA